MILDEGVEGMDEGWAALVWVIRRERARRGPYDRYIDHQNRTSGARCSHSSAFASTARVR